MAASPAEARVTPAPFPVRSKHAANAIEGIQTEATAMYFADKIILTLAQEGRLAHWVMPCPLSNYKRLI